MSSIINGVESPVDESSARLTRSWSWGANCLEEFDTNGGQRFKLNGQSIDRDDAQTTLNALLETAVGPVTMSWVCS